MSHVQLWIDPPGVMKELITELAGMHRGDRDPQHAAGGAFSRSYGVLCARAS